MSRQRGVQAAAHHHLSWSVGQSSTVDKAALIPSVQQSMYAPLPPPLLLARPIHFAYMQPLIEMAYCVAI